jgi:regulator of cell morphogenesis and NO signaling
MSLMEQTDRQDWAANEAFETDAELIQRLIERYHVPHLRDLVTAVELARRVEARHAGAPGCPVGLADRLSQVFDHLSQHQAREETVLFPAMLAGGGPMLAFPMAVMAAEHDAVREALSDLQRLTNGFVPPAGACGSWIGLYDLCRKFDGELREHVRLEDEVLFPRFL